MKSVRSARGKKVGRGQTSWTVLAVDTECWPIWPDLAGRWKRMARPGPTGL